MINFEAPHRRYNVLTGEWVLVSPHRTKRPWQGKQEKPSLEKKAAYDPDCYLCAGNQRANGEMNPAYKDTYAFTNDFPALLPEIEESQTSDRFLISRTVRGTSRVLCFSPDHSLSLPEMEVGAIKKVIDLWIDEYVALSNKYHWVQIFENKGEIMGSSNPHPHGQVWASDQLPNEAMREDLQQKSFYEESGEPLLLSYVAQEIEISDRIVVMNDDWVALVPFWAIWPYELLLIPRRRIRRLPELSAKEKRSLAEISKTFLTKYDNLFQTSFPYSMGWHNAPNPTTVGKEPDAFDHWQLHAHYYPPLLRSATVKKFLVGYEMLAEAQRDITAEMAAAQLRDLPEIHYRELLEGN